MSQKKILLVDDEPDFLYLTGICLKDFGFLVELAENGKSCLEKAAAFQPDVILLDIRMPEMDGWKVCEELLKFPNTQKIPVYFLTALVGRDLEERAVKTGARGILRKPLGSNELLQSVRQILGEISP
ncbi:MAG: response regulator [Deltaproteobacteria bacterium]|nr:response regulator [Deltaproteobacteria bacterium]